jgi:hypothetical protein
MTERLTIGGRTFFFPWATVCRPLTAEERGRLRASIEAHGIRHQVLIDESDNVVDGAHRLQLAVELEIPLKLIPFAKVAAGMSWEERSALAEELNAARRQMSADDLKAAAAARRERVASAREEGKSLRTIAKEEGVSPEQVRRDLETESKTGSGVTPVTPDTTTNAAAELWQTEEPPVRTTPAPRKRSPKITGQDGKTYSAKAKPSKPAEPAPTIYCTRCARFVEQGGQPVRDCLQCDEARKAGTRTAQKGSETRYTLAATPSEQAGSDGSTAKDHIAAIVEAIRDYDRVFHPPAALRNGAIDAVTWMGEGDVLSPAPIPAELDTPEFRAAWQSWLNDRRERKIKPYTAGGAKGQLGKLAKIGPVKSVAAIEYSIAQGYQGIIEEKQNGQQRKRPDMRTRATADRPGSAESPAQDNVF